MTDKEAIDMMQRCVETERASFDFESYSGRYLNVLVRQNGKQDFRQVTMREGESFDAAIQRFLRGRRSC